VPKNPLLENRDESPVRNLPCSDRCDKMLIGTPDSVTRMPLSDIEREITKAVVKGFILDWQPTPRLSLLAEFEDSKAIAQLSNRRVLASEDSRQSFLPTVLAFHYCDDPALLEKAKFAVQEVTRVLQALLRADWSNPAHTPGDLTWRIDGSHFPLAPHQVRLGLLLVREIPGILNHSQMNNVHTEVIGFRIDEDIVGFKDISQVWDDYIRDQTAHFDAPPQGLSVIGRATTTSNQRDVFVIHGRDERLRAGLFEFLRSIGLNPMEWTQLIDLTDKAAPYVGEVLDAAFLRAQAVVVLFSPDDLVRLRPELCAPHEPDHETMPSFQARPNVLFEAGMAMARHPDRTVLIEIGALRPFSDIGGRHTIRMDNSPKKRQELALRLQKAGCSVSLIGTDWHTAGDMKGPPVAAPRDNALPEPDRTMLEEPKWNQMLADLVSELEDNLHHIMALRLGDVYARPSVDAWKTIRNRLLLPDGIRSRVTNAYRRIDSWKMIVETGINPNMGSVALENIAAGLKLELPNLIGELSKLPSASKG